MLPTNSVRNEALISNLISSNKTLNHQNIEPLQVVYEIEECIKCLAGLKQKKRAK
jgi:hypothetical protein